MGWVAVEDERRRFHVDGQLGGLRWSEFGTVFRAAFGWRVGALASQTTAMTLIFVEEIHDGNGWFSLGAWSSFSSFSSFFRIINFMRVDSDGLGCFYSLDGTANSSWDRHF